MASFTVNEVLWSNVQVFSGTAGAVAGTPVGFVRKEGKVDYNFTRDVDRLMVQGRMLQQKVMIKSKGVSVTTPLFQCGNVDLMALCLGLTKVGNVLTVGDTTDNAQLSAPEFSMAFVANTVAGTVVRLDIPYAVSIADMTLSLMEAQGDMPFGVEAVDGGAQPYFTFGAAAINVTLATGVLTRTGAYHRVLGEGGAADALTSIVAADLVDNEILRIQIQSATMPITVTHATGVGQPQLAGGANWVMTDIRSFLDLKYDLAGTKWVEFQRYNATLADA